MMIDMLDLDLKTYSGHLDRPAYVQVLSREQLEALRPNIATIIASSQGSEPGKRAKGITFEDAKRDENLRQTYLDQLFDENPSLYVRRLVYDPTGEKYNRRVQELIASGDLDPSEIDEDARLERRINMLMEQGIIQVDPKEREAYRFCLKNFFREVNMEIEKVTFGTYILSSKRMGNNQPIIIFMSEVAFFEGDSEELFKTRVEHEYEHAKQVYDGIRMGPYIINHRAIAEFNIQYETILSLTESIAYIDDIERLKDYPRFGKHSNEYQDAVAVLALYDDALQKIVPNSDFEREVIKFQLRRNRQYLPEDSKDTAVVTRKRFITEENLENYARCMAKRLGLELDPLRKGLKSLFD